MCRTDETKYYTKGGVVDLNTESENGLNTKTIEELSKTSATQLDLYYIRKDLKKIILSLKINIGNGSGKLASLGEITLINYHDLKLIRDVNKIYLILKSHKIIVMGLILLSLFFQEELGEFGSFIFQSLNVIKKTVFPILN